MATCGVEKMAPATSGESQMSCSVHEGTLTIGQTKTELYRNGNQAKVPDVVFYDTDQVREVLIILPVTVNHVL